MIKDDIEQILDSIVDKALIQAIHVSQLTSENINNVSNMVPLLKDILKHTYNLGWNAAIMTMREKINEKLMKDDDEEKKE